MNIIYIYTGEKALGDLSRDMSVEFDAELKPRESMDKGYYYKLLGRASGYMMHVYVNKELTPGEVCTSGAPADAILVSLHTNLDDEIVAEKLDNCSDLCLLRNYPAE